MQLLMAAFIEILIALGTSSVLTFVIHQSEKDTFRGCFWD